MKLRSRQSATIHELCDIVGNLTEQQENLRDHFGTGLTHYRNQELGISDKLF